MSMREIDTIALLDNVELMINTLQYDSMRSAGKTKMNAPALVSLYKANFKSYTKEGGSIDGKYRSNNRLYP